MSKRFWFYLPVVIVISGLVSYLTWSNSKINDQISSIETSAETQRLESMESWLTAQTDGRKLITLAKTLQKTQPELVESIVLKAYELLPDNRDAAILASHYKPEIKEKIKTLDPLYEEK